jgi:regulator of cell morphogenesis and NO signaling
MGGLVGDDHRVLLVMSRFGIGLGFGEKSVGEVCAQSGVDAGTFLAVVNLLLTGDAGDASQVSVGALQDYLHSSHDYFLGFSMPAIRAWLAAAVGDRDDLSKAIMRYFDEYIAGVRKHMEYEEKTVFPYVNTLLSGERPKDGYNIEVFSRRHDHVEARLDEFKNIFIKYYTAPSTNEINGILFDVISCAQDLASHNDVEDHIFVPAIEALERKTAQIR